MFRQNTIHDREFTPLKDTSDANPTANATVRDAAGNIVAATKQYLGGCSHRDCCQPAFERLSGRILCPDHVQAKKTMKPGTITPIQQRALMRYWAKRRAKQELRISKLTRTARGFF